MLDFERPYCLIHANGQTRYISGEIRTTKLLSEIPRSDRLPVISMVPYSQLRERGFLVHDEGEVIISLVGSQDEQIDLESIQAAPALEPDHDIVPEFDVDDEQFADRVRQIINNEICRGEGSNFLFSRKCLVTIPDFSSDTANRIFRRLVRNETGAYMTFCFFDGHRYFIGSSPERHITIQRGVVTMNPICGTLPKATLRGQEDLLAFLTDPKEINELFQVVDEELKMMSRICAAGGVVRGPYLKEMSALFHTEYMLEGHTSMDIIDAFRDSMFAATMLGSPLENAARVIHKYETDSRRYYTSALVLLERDTDGEEYLDSAITIRTMEVTPTGSAVLQAGATIVRDSVPERECQEVKAKVAGLLTAISSPKHMKPVPADFYNGLVEQTLQSRNALLSQFWTEQQEISAKIPGLEGKSILVIDNEDEFTHMLSHMLNHLGLTATVCDYDDPGLYLDDSDIVLVGPGPGDPNNLTDPKMKRVHELINELLSTKSRFLAVCLGHQVLCHRLGMAVRPIDPPLQGVQKSINLFGQQEPVGFYNTFCPRNPHNASAGVELAIDSDEYVMALRAPRFHSFQFHVESVLTTNGISILGTSLSKLLQ